MENGRNTINPPKTVLVDGAKQWDNALFGNFLGKSPTLGVFQKTADKLKVVATEVVSDDYVICDVLNSLKVHVESEIVVETSVDENLVSSGIVVESEVFAADGSKPIETAMVKEGVDPSKYVNGKEILVAPNRFDILDVVNHEEENCISPKKDRIDDAGLLS
ncbi:hypothetical protein V6N11_065822 [Hibiscus sabdariffa]|uniref:Uncharacterized protein n=1 Tax=Hibiscus sabdariffa TaxID=183260 RepID=A0ABR2PIF8_9ROSI